MKFPYLVLWFFLGCFLALSAEAREKPLLSSLGESPGVTRDDLIYLLSEKTGGEPLMAELLLARMDPEEEKELVSRLTDTLVLDMAAKLNGLDLREDLRLRIKWEKANLLARAYVEKLEASWDLSEEALRSYYELHKNVYVREMEACLSCYYYPTEEKARSALMASLGKTGTEKLALSGFSRRIPLGWVTSEDVAPEYLDIFLSPDFKSFLGPLETPEKEYVLVFVENRMDTQALTFEEARGQILQDMEMAMLEEELQELRRRFDVKIYEKEIEGSQPYEF